MDKKLYLWDLADTLFYEKWDAEKTEFPSYDGWVESRLGRKRSEITDREYEQAYEIPYKQGWYFALDVQPGFREVLSWTKENAIFTTGLPIQLEWRAYYLNPRLRLRIQDFFKAIYSTFDYGETNVKTKGMLVDVLRKVRAQGYDTVVYTDDKEKNCQFFLEAANELAQDDIPLNVRAQWVRHDQSGIRVHDNKFIELGSLYDLKEYEQR